MNALIHLIPDWPASEPNGVRDYASVLQQALRERHGIGGGFIALRGAATAHMSLFVAATPTPDALGEALNRAAGQIKPSALLLHYSGYGYARRGAPLWLPDLLRRAKRQCNLRIFTMFHELYATGRPWQSAFWLGPLQRHVAHAVARESAARMTNRQSYARWLDSRAEPRASVTAHLPVFSNVGEPVDSPDWNRREPRLVIWSGGAHKRAFYARRGDDLRALCSTLKVRQIVDIGATSGLAPAQVPGVEFREAGLLAVDELSRLLSGSRYGLLLGYPAAYLAKSGIYAAYCAHGLLTFLADERPAVEDDLAPDRDFFSIESPPAEGRLAAISEAMRVRYAAHDSTAHAARIAEWMRGAGP